MTSDVRYGLRLTGVPWMSVVATSPPSYASVAAWFASTPLWIPSMSLTMVSAVIRLGRAAALESVMAERNRAARLVICILAVGRKVRWTLIV